MILAIELSDKRTSLLKLLPQRGIIGVVVCDQIATTHTLNNVTHLLTPPLK